MRGLVYVSYRNDLASRSELLASVDSQRRATGVVVVPKDASGAAILGVAYEWPVLTRLNC